MIRTRLTIWNSIVVAFVLMVLGTTVYLSTSFGLYRGIDDELARRNHFMENNWTKFPAPMSQPEMSGMFDAQNRLGIDPKLLENIEFEGNIARPRILRPDGSDRMFPANGMWSRSGFKEALKGHSTYETITIQGRRLRVLSVPLREKGKIAAVGQQMASLSEADKQMVRLRDNLLTLIPMALVATYFASIFLTHRALKPVREIANAASLIEATNLDGRLAVEGNDDFAKLSMTFNSMLGRLQSSFSQLERAYETQRRFTADASHELKTPLTVIRTRVGVALRGPRDPDRYLDHIQAIGASAQVMTTLVQDLLLLAQSDEGRLTVRPERVELFDLLHEAASHAGVDRLSVEVREDLAIVADRSLLMRVFVNLIDNANRHTGPTGKLNVTASTHAQGVQISVSDTGVGIPPEHLEKVFERFHRVDSSRVRDTGGTGLGLPIAKSIIEAHGGSLTITSELGVGTTVTAVLPGPDVTSSAFHLSAAS